MIGGSWEGPRGGTRPTSKSAEWLTRTTVGLETFQPAEEVVQGKALADAAVAAKVKLYIWSSLPRTGVAHFNSKADVEDYIRTLPLMAAFFMPGWFMQNFFGVMAPKRRVQKTKQEQQEHPSGRDEMEEEEKEEEEYVVSQPWPGAGLDSLVPLIDIEDTGKYVAPFLVDPNKYAGSRFWACTRFYSVEEICRVWTDVTGKKVVFDERVDWISGGGTATVMKDALEKSLGKTGKANGYFGVEGEEGVKWTLEQVGEKLTTWEEFVKRSEPWFV